MRPLLSGHHERLRYQQYSEGMLAVGLTAVGTKTAPTYRPGTVRTLRRGRLLVIAGRCEGVPASVNEEVPGAALDAQISALPQIVQALAATVGELQARIEMSEAQDAAADPAAWVWFAPPAADGDPRTTVGTCAEWSNATYVGTEGGRRSRFRGAGGTTPVWQWRSPPWPTPGTRPISDPRRRPGKRNTGTTSFGPVSLIACVVTGSPILLGR